MKLLNIRELGSYYIFHVLILYATHYFGTCLSNEIDGVSELRKQLHHTNLQFLSSRLPYYTVPRGSMQPL